MHLKRIQHINILLQFSILGTPLPYLPHDTIILVDCQNIKPIRENNELSHLDGSRHFAFSVCD